MTPQRSALYDDLDDPPSYTGEVEQTSEDDLWFLPGPLEEEPRYCHVNFRALQEPPVSAGSGNVGCGCPGFDSFHSVISDSQGGAASGWNGKTISGSGMN